MVDWTTSQKQRLKELDAEPSLLQIQFEEKSKRDIFFRETEKKLVQETKAHLTALQESGHIPQMCQMERRLVDCLVGEKFVQVVTPIMLSKEMLAKMTIDETHELSRQVYWLDDKKCLRPMLAPNLYYVWRDLIRLWEKPIRIFEVGPCFRKESKGAHHLSEFTMLNFTELGVEEGTQETRLKELIAKVMAAAGIEEYELIRKSSEVYGETIDVMVEGMELGSGAFGPHPLDDNWGIFDTWVGLGLGVERLTMIKNGYRNIKRVGRSLSYLDGARLNI